MDSPPLDAETERLVREIMDKHGCSREEAILAVALERGEVYGDGDLVTLRPLTPEERKLTGLDHDPHRIAAETRARAAARTVEAERAKAG
jgi:hypothetical protein